MTRKQKKYHFIYKTTNLLSGNYYIGMHSTSNLEDGYMGSGKRLRYSINKYGKENHQVEILEYLDSREDLKNREREIVNLNEIAKDKCINLKVGGEGGFVNGGGFFSKEHQIKCSKAGNISFKQNLKDDKELLEKFQKMGSDKWKAGHKNGLFKYDNFRDKTHTAETKKKMSLSHKDKGLGSDNSQYGTCWITNDKKNKKIYKGDMLPTGWRLGRVFKSKP